MKNIPEKFERKKFMDLKNLICILEKNAQLKRNILSISKLLYYICTSANFTLKVQKQIKHSFSKVKIFDLEK